MKKIMTIILLTIVPAGFAIAQNGADEQELIWLQKEWSANYDRKEDQDGF